MRRKYDGYLWTILILAALGLAAQLAAVRACWPD